MIVSIRRRAPARLVTEKYGPPRSAAVELDKLPPDRAPTRRDWARLSKGWSGRIDERIAELERLKAGLTECIGCGCLSLERCKLATPTIARAASPAVLAGRPPRLTPAVRRRGSAWSAAGDSRPRRSR